MKYGLTPIWIRIQDHPIALFLDPRISREIAREREQPAEQIGVLGVVERADVCGRNDEQMRRRLGIQVPEGEHVVFALDDGRRNLTRPDQPDGWVESSMNAPE